ncbi:MAG: PAS domain S-box protein [Nitrospirae bacterium]|nr:PAS domain S-box protein [Nitrospirota bacterium]
MRFLTMGFLIFVIHSRFAIHEQKKTGQALRETTYNLQSLIQASPEAIIAVKINGNVTIWSPSAERIFGWKKDEVLGHPNPIVPKEKQNEYLEIRKKTHEGQEFRGLELRRQKKDGSVIDISLSTAAMRNAEGAIIGVMGILTDITEHKRIEEEVQQARYDWEDTFNTITDMITVHDKDFNIIRTNKAAEKILKLPFLEKNEGTKCFRYYHGKEAPPEGCPSCGCLKTGAPATFEIFEPHLNMFIEIRAIPRFDNNNNLIGLIHVVRDITERKNTEERVNKLLYDVTKAKKEWEITFDSVSEIIMLLDKELTIIRANKSLADFAGIPINEVIGHKYYEYFPPEPELLEKLKSGSSSEWVEVKTETGHWLYLSHCPVFDEDNGDLLHSIVVATDITRLHNAQQQITESDKELRKKIEDLEKFYEMAVGRELKMQEMKKEIKRLHEELLKYNKESETTEGFML